METKQFELKVKKLVDEKLVSLKSSLLDLFLDTYNTCRYFSSKMVVINMYIDVLEDINHLIKKYRKEEKE